MLEEKKLLNFKRAVFVTENSWFDDKLSYNTYITYISLLTNVCKEWGKANPLLYYKQADSLQVAMGGAIFHIMTDTVKDVSGKLICIPYKYDFDDCFAQQNWTNMFVTKLMTNHKGNCHSLPILYKILADELGVKAYLSFAPNHMYIKQKSKIIGWYNTELTNALFPNDAWIMASGYVSREAIVSGIYMDTLSEKQSIVLCLNDLAKGYLRKFKNPDLLFVINCCNLGLKYYPNYAELLLLKAETLKKIYENYIAKYGLNSPQYEEHKEKIQNIFSEMETSYALLAKLDYREIPEEMYFEWMKSLERDKAIYQDGKMNSVYSFDKKQ